MIESVIMVSKSRECDYVCGYPTWCLLQKYLEPSDGRDWPRERANAAAGFQKCKRRDSLSKDHPEDFEAGQRLLDKRKMEEKY